MVTQWAYMKSGVIRVLRKLVVGIFIPRFRWSHSIRFGSILCNYQKTGYHLNLTRVIQRTLADPMFRIVSISRLFLTPVTPDVVAPTAVILWNFRSFHPFTNTGILNYVSCVIYYINTCYPYTFMFLYLCNCELVYLYTCVLVLIYFHTFSIVVFKCFSISVL